MEQCGESSLWEVLLIPITFLNTTFSTKEFNGLIWENNYTNGRCCRSLFPLSIFGFFWHCGTVWAFILKDHIGLLLKTDILSPHASLINKATCSCTEFFELCADQPLENRQAVCILSCGISSAIFFREPRHTGSVCLVPFSFRCNNSKRDINKNSCACSQEYSFECAFPMKNVTFYPLLHNRTEVSSERWWLKSEMDINTKASWCSLLSDTHYYCSASFLTEIGMFFTCRRRFCHLSKGPFLWPLNTFDSHGFELEI